MPTLINAPSVVPVPGGKLIEEFAGRASTGSAHVSVAHMVAPPGWYEPAQTPEFEEITVVLRVLLHVEHADGTIDVAAGQGVRTGAGERVRYLVGDEGAEYIAVCLPAFDPDLVHRED